MSSLAYLLSEYPMDLNNATDIQLKVKSQFDNECDEILRVETFECSECDVTFRDLDDYLRHASECLEYDYNIIKSKANYLDIYLKRDKVKTTRQIPGDHICKYCQVGFKSDSLLKQHANRGAKTCAKRRLKSIIENTNIEDQKDILILIYSKYPELKNNSKIKQN